VNEVGSGVINGGWDYIWAAYAITWFVFISYSVSLVVRDPGEGR
jgi:hypothetical protein